MPRFVAILIVLGLTACGGGRGAGDYSTRDFARDYPGSNERAVDTNRDGNVSESELDKALRAGLLL